MPRGVREVTLRPRPAPDYDSRVSRPAPHPPTLGLTGGIGAGKSTVARILAEEGCLVCDSDALAREALHHLIRERCRVDAERGELRALRASASRERDELQGEAERLRALQRGIARLSQGNIAQRPQAQFLALAAPLEQEGPSLGATGFDAQVQPAAVSVRVTGT
jgi:hypothetical protein